jgi:hypothetical protein
VRFVNSTRGNIFHVIHSSLKAIHPLKVLDLRPLGNGKLDVV